MFEGLEGGEILCLRCKELLLIQHARPAGTLTTVREFKLVPCSICGDWPSGSHEFCSGPCRGFGVLLTLKSPLERLADQAEPE
jgi:hypothetical protein